MDATYEQLLQESRDRYESLVHCLPDAVIVHSESRITFVNEAALKLFGARDRQELEGKLFFDIIHPDYQIGLKERLEWIIDQGKPSGSAIRKLVRLDGSTISVELRAIPTTYNGKPAIQLLIRDISPMIQMEETLNEKNDLYKTLVESVVAGVFVAQQNEIVYANPYLVDMLGYSLEELRKFQVDEIVDHSELVLMDYRDCMQSMKGMEHFPFQIKGKRKDGSSIYLEGNCSLISFDGKEALLGTIQDVTSKHEQEQLLHNNAKLYQQMLMCILSPYLLCMKRKCCTRINMRSLWLVSQTTPISSVKTSIALFMSMTGSL